MQQLIFVDGVPGSGKTTTAFWLAEVLRQRGIETQAWWEGDEGHPLHSFWTWDDGYSDLAEIEVPFDANVFTDRVVDRLAKLVSSEGTKVIEGYPFQSVVRIHLKMGSTTQQIRNYFTAFSVVVAPLEPLLIFLDPPDRQRHFEDACAVRGEAFEKLLIGSATRSPYGRRHKLEGWDGLLQFERVFDGVVKSLLAQWRYELRVYQPTVQGWDWVRNDILQPSSFTRQTRPHHRKCGG